METSVARELARLTRAFYDEVSDSFSATRATPWPGWQRVLQEAGVVGARAPRLRVLDLACGNLRFARYLGAACAAGDGRKVDLRAVDACDGLAANDDTPGVAVTYQHLDIVEALLAGDDLARCIEAEGCDLAVCFGFMHHLALPAHRRHVLEALASCCRPGGYVAVSFWQLSRSARLLAKARETTEVALPALGLGALDAGDYLLGWQGRTDVVRYCHDFSEEEIDGLAAAVRPQAREVARFSADGAEGNLNRYLLLQARGK